MNVVLAPEAEQDLSDIFDFILKDRPTSAQYVLDRINDQINKLCDYPNLGRPGRVPRTKELVIPNLPFIIPYQVNQNTLEILRVFHTARKWPDTL